MLSMVVADPCSLDGDESRLPVDVGPLEATDLSATHPRGRCQPIATCCGMSATFSALTTLGGRARIAGLIFSQSQSTPR